MARCIVMRDLESGDRTIAGEDLGTGKIPRETDCDTARTRAEVEDPPWCGIEGQGNLDEMLGLGPWDQDA